MEIERIQIRTIRRLKNQNVRKWVQKCQKIGPKMSENGSKNVRKLISGLIESQIKTEPPPIRPRYPSYGYGTNPCYF